MLTWRIQGDNPRYLLKASLSEFISTLIFVFAGQGSGMAYSKLTGNGRSMPAGLVAAALGHGFGLMAAVSASWRVSGGHVNPAVTFGVLIQGRISILRGILYWVAQLFGSTVACLLLKLATHGMVTTAFSLSQGETVGNAFVLEMVMTFGLVYTVCATGVDHGKDFLETIGAVAIGFVVGANILVGGAFDGASMNPALAFGPALVSWTWLNHWVYWVGPLVGGGLAGFIYQFVLVGLKDSENPQGRS